MNNTPTVLSSAQLYDPSTRMFTATTSMTTARYGPIAAPLPNGDVLIAGGYDGTNVLRSAELFDPTNDTFTPLTASGNTELQVGREFAAAAPLPNGDVLIAGGTPQSGPSLQSAELFDPSNDTFTMLPASGSTELQAPITDAVAAPLPDGDVLIAGGA